MKIAVASGKGGTGKTTVSASLCSVWDAPVIAADLDVEEPNLHLFLRPNLTAERKVELEVPRLDPTLCTACGACADLCQFKAVAMLGVAASVFADMCHGCGGCTLVCPTGALAPSFRELGMLAEGEFGNGAFLEGRLRVGEAMSPPLMRAVQSRLSELLVYSPGPEPDAILDAPPGVSCPAMSAVQDADIILLVTEPTPFGLYDLTLAHQAFEPLGKPMGVVINRAGLGDDGVERYCRGNGLAVLARIPFDREAARGYSRGRIVAKVSPELHKCFENLRDTLRAMAPDRNKGAANA